ncbi:MAG: ATP-binding protein [Anaerolineales bacterium]
MTTKPLPIGLQTFRKIIEGGYLYVDKTRLLYEIIQHESGIYFLSRPRRFGKSLLLSTLDEIFQGNRELFKGLWLYDSPYNWQKHPVIRFDFSLIRAETAEEVQRGIVWQIKMQARQHNITLMGENYLEMFSDLIYQLAAERQVVILVDEYDKPMLDQIENAGVATAIRDALKSFYTIIKGMDAYVRFVLLTGVSKFSRVGVFSGLNNLNDLTMDNAYATLLGVTQNELETYFAEYLQAFADTHQIAPAELRQQIRLWYNGFCFSSRCETVYNPFSLLLLFQKQKFQNYWFESGTPTFLLKLLKDRHYDLQTLQELEIPELAFSTYEIESLEIVPLLVQSGYLTIQGYDPASRRYRLGYPNYEVEHAFLAYLLGTYGAIEKATATNLLGHLVTALQAANWTRFFTVLNSLLASISYELHISQERYYQSIFYLIFKLIGLEIHAEVRTNQGRIDAVIQTAQAVYIFEFKLDDSAQAALDQIHSRAYFAPYLAATKPIHLLGIRFDVAHGSITEWLAQQRN